MSNHNWRLVMQHRILVGMFLLAGLFLSNQSVTAQSESFFYYSGRFATSANDEPGNGIPGVVVIFDGHCASPPCENYFAQGDSQGYFSIAIPPTGEPGLHYHPRFANTQGYSFSLDYIPFEEDTSFYFIPIP
jgi:hypothetical protein